MLAVIVIGIDPGQTGAIAVIKNGAVTHLHDMPVSARIYGKGQQVNGGELASLLMEARDGKPCIVLLEAVSAMPGNGGSSMFRFGESVGVVMGVCGTLQLPVHWIAPSIWKKRAGLTGKDKDAARTMAIQMFPGVADQLTRKKDVGRADAILIAHFGGAQ